MIDAFYEVDYIKPFDRNESYYSQIVYEEAYHQS